MRQESVENAGSDKFRVQSLTDLHVSEQLVPEVIYKYFFLFERRLVNQF